jgi:hypothetical protein
MNNEMPNNNDGELGLNKGMAQVVAESGMQREQMTEEDLIKEVDLINEMARREAQEQMKAGMIKKPNERKISQEEIEKVREVIKKALNIGIWPIKSISLKDIETVKKEGLQETPGWDKRWKLACTILRNPLDKVSGEEDRGFFQVPNIEEKNLSPRFTGPEKLFEGVVCINDFVPPDKIKFLGYAKDLKKEENEKGDE